MKRYSSGLYARLGFAVAIYSHPDIVLVDEVLAVGDAAFRRRALEALRRLIADGKTVLFISHDMWNVRRLCDRDPVDGGGPRARVRPGRRDRRALHERGEPRRRWRTRPTALQSHRGGTGEIRYAAVDLVDAAAGRRRCSRRATRWSCARRTAPSGPSNGRCFRSPSSTSTPAWSSRRRRRRAGRCRRTPCSDGGVIECRFAHLPLRPRQYVAAAVDHRQPPARVVRRRDRRARVSRSAAAAAASTASPTKRTVSCRCRSSSAICAPR